MIDANTWIASAIYRAICESKPHARARSGERERVDLRRAIYETISEVISMLAS